MGLCGNVIIVVVLLEKYIKKAESSGFSSCFIKLKDGELGFAQR